MALFLSNIGQKGEIVYTKLTSSPTAVDASDVYFFIMRENNTAPVLSINGQTQTKIDNGNIGNAIMYIYKIDELHATDTISVTGGGVMCYVQ